MSVCVSSFCLPLSFHLFSLSLSFCVSLFSIHLYFLWVCVFSLRLPSLSLCVSAWLIYILASVPLRIWSASQDNSFLCPWSL